MGTLRVIIIVLATVMSIAGVLVPRHIERDQISPPKVAKILFVGDMMFDRTMRSVAESKGYGFLFSCLDSYLRDFDLIVGNMEGPITFAESVSVGTRPGIPGNTSFTFSPLVAGVLHDKGFRVVNLGNNHILDRGWDGMESTRRVLEDNGVGYFGLPGGDIATTTVVRGERIGFVNFNQFSGEDDSSKVLQAIETLKPSPSFVIVYAHWGEEYVQETERQRFLARAFIDGGGDLVIGSHPHVIQAIEEYKGKKIYYSLGNFIFDQYFSKEVSLGMGVEIVLVDGKATLKERFFDISRDGRTCLSAADGQAKN